MAFRFTRRESIAAGVLRLASGELVAAAALLRDDATTATLRVHGARKASKRVRALLRLVRAGLAAPRFRAANLGLRDAARGLAAARDAVVALATFDDLVPIPGDELAPVRAALLAAAEASGTAGVGPELLARAADALDRVHAQLSDGLVGRALTWDHLEAGLRDSYAEGRRAMRAASSAVGSLTMRLACVRKPASQARSIASLICVLRPKSSAVRMSCFKTRDETASCAAPR